MIKRIAALERKYKEAMERIRDLEERLDRLEGRSERMSKSELFRRIRLAIERGDKAEVQRCNELLVPYYVKKEDRSGKDRSGGGESTEV